MIRGTKEENMIRRTKEENMVRRTKQENIMRRTEEENARNVASGVTRARVFYCAVTGMPVLLE